MDTSPTEQLKQDIQRFVRPQTHINCGRSPRGVLVALKHKTGHDYTGAAPIEEILVELGFKIKGPCCAVANDSPLFD